MTGIRRAGSVLYTCALMFALTAMSGCKGGGSGSDSASASAADSSVNDAPTISGAAASTAKPNAAYSFKPTASDPNGDTLSFQVQNKPAWATFNTLTGELTGIPTLAQGQAFANIIISASDGKSSASLAPFTISLDSPAAAPRSTGVTLSWTAPTQKVDGSQLNDLAGYTISFGTSENALSRTVTVDNPSIDRYVFDTLPSGTYYFGIRAISASGGESQLSEVVRRVVS
jgi:Putative Ig domain